MTEKLDWRVEYAHIKLSEKELRDLYEWILDNAGTMFVGEMGPGVELSEEVTQKLEKKAASFGVNAQELYEAAFFAWSSGEE